MFTDLSRYLVCSDRMLVRLLPVAEEVPQKHQRQRDAEPHRAHAQHGGEGDRSARMFAPDKEVDDEADPEDDTRVEAPRQQSRRLV